MNTPSSIKICFEINCTDYNVLKNLISQVVGGENKNQNNRPSLTSPEMFLKNLIITKNELEFIKPKNLYNLYVRYCIESNLRTELVQTFNKIIRDLGIEVVKRRTNYYHVTLQALNAIADKKKWFDNETYLDPRNEEIIRLNKEKTPTIQVDSLPLTIQESKIKKKVVLRKKPDPVRQGSPIVVTPTPATPETPEYDVFATL
jgi:hypothetical protein